MAYSKDYRQMILDKLDEGYSYRELAEEYQISTTTIQRWKKNIERKAYVYTAVSYTHLTLPTKRIV